MASRLNRAQVDVAGTIVEITWSERATLLRKLQTVAGGDAIVQKLIDAVGASRPTELDDEQRSRLRVTLERWGFSVLPDGLEHLLVALVRADPRGHVGTTTMRLPPRTDASSSTCSSGDGGLRLRQRAGTTVKTTTSQVPAMAAAPVAYENITSRLRWESAAVNRVSHTGTANSRTKNCPPAEIQPA
jgi:hypothetical protein